MLFFQDASKVWAVNVLALGNRAAGCPIALARLQMHCRDKSY